MNKVIKVNSAERARKVRYTGMLIGGLCIIACKLPLLLVFVGFGGLGTAASLFGFSPVAQSIVLSIAAAGMALAGFMFLMYRRKNQ